MKHAMALHASRRPESGVCHHCGWTGRVSRVSRAERRGLGLDRSTRRLCPECVSWLASSPAGVAGTGRHPVVRLDTARQRRVA